MTVFIDPGHGGQQSGAIGRDPWTVHEADINWSVSVALSQYLARHGVEHRLTRRQAETVLLAPRADAANEAGAALFVSIHCNSFESPHAHGIEVLHAGTIAGRELAEAILTSIDPAGMRYRNRGLKERPRLLVLRRTRMPAALVELPFVSNRSNLERLVEASEQARFAERIGAAIRAWV